MSLKDILMKYILLTVTLSILCSFRSSTGAEHAGEVPTTKISISCLNTIFIKEPVVISSDTAYANFIKKTSVAELIGGECLNYQAPKIDFNTYHLLVIHASCGGCEAPEIEKSFLYNNTTDKYEYSLIFKQKGICKKGHNFFECILVKRSDIDISKLTFSARTIMPPRENRE